MEPPGSTEGFFSHHFLFFSFTWKSGSNAGAGLRFCILTIESGVKMSAVGSRMIQVPGSSRGTTRTEREKKPKR